MFRKTRKKAMKNFSCIHSIEASELLVVDEADLTQLKVQ